MGTRRLESDDERVQYLTVICIALIRKHGGSVTLTQDELKAVSGHLGVALEYNEDGTFTVFDSSGMSSDELPDEDITYDN